MWTVPRNLLEVMSPLEDVQATLPHLTLSIPKALGYCNPLLILPLRSNCFFSFSKKLSNLRSKEITKLGIPTEDFLCAPLELLPEAASNSMISFDIMLLNQHTLLHMWVLMYWKVASLPNLTSHRTTMGNFLQYMVRCQQQYQLSLICRNGLHVVKASRKKWNSTREALLPSNTNSDCDNDL